MLVNPTILKGRYRITTFLVLLFLFSSGLYGQVTKTDTISLCSSKFSYEYDSSNQAKFICTSSPEPDSILWSFGDGTFGSGKEIVHQYPGSGTYEVKNTVYYSSIGMLQVTCEDTKTLQVSINSDGIKDSVCQSKLVIENKGDTYFFNDMTKHDSKYLVLSEWIFADTSLQGQNVNLSFIKPGTYTGEFVKTVYTQKILPPDVITCLSLECTHEIYCQEKQPFSFVVNPLITFYPDYCQAKIDYKNGNGTQFYFEDIIAKDTNRNFGIHLWHWNFGDGDTAQGRSVSHMYKSPGKYQVVLTKMIYNHVQTLVACDEVYFDTLFQRNFSCYERSSCRKQFTIDVIVSDPSVNDFDCNADFQYRQTPDSLTLEAYDPKSIHNLWVWDLGDGNKAMGKTIYHSYSTNGTYNVCLKKYTYKSHEKILLSDEMLWDLYLNDSSKFCVSTHCKNIYFYNVSTDSTLAHCKTSISYHTSNGVTEIEDNFYLPTFAPDSTITFWAWKLGNGNIKTGRKIKHDFQDPGYYEINLTKATYDTSHGSLTCKGFIYDSTLTVSIPCYYKEICRVSVPVNIEMKDSTAALNCKADIIYQVSGNKLQIRDEIVLMQPAIYPPSAIIKWNWNFGDGSVDSGAAVTHEYLMQGNYTVSLKKEVWQQKRLFNCFECDLIFDTLGNVIVPDHYYKVCEESYSVMVTIFDDKDSSCKFIEYSVGADNDVSFSTSPVSLPEVDLQGGIKMIWDFGDGTHGEGFAVKHKYENSGNYYVCAFINSPLILSKPCCKYISLGENKISSLVYPDPLVDQGTFVIKNLKGNYTLNLYDIRGVLVKSVENTEEAQVILNKNDLREGIHFYQVLRNGELVSKGKFSVR